MDDKFSSIDKIFLIILLCGLLSIISGCASQSSREDSTNYVAQAQPHGYPCPSCGFLIPDKDVSPNIRVENKCTNCGKIFFGVPKIESKDEVESQGKPYQGPSVFARGYHSDIKYENNNEYKIKNSWYVSKDGNSGSISSTTIIKNEHTRNGEYGRTTGPAGLGHYGGY